MEPDPKVVPGVFLGVPNQGTIHPDMVRCIANASQKRPVWYEPEEGSGTCFIFNKLICKALNMRPRPHWFAMLHSDVFAQPGWVDGLIEKMEREDLDVCAAHVALKDTRGLVSTAVWNREADQYRVLTQKEAREGAGDNGPVLTNSGCMVIRFTEPWAEEICFTMIDTITKRDDGSFMPHVWSEDWNFAEWCHRRGLRVGTVDDLLCAHRGPKWWEIEPERAVEKREWFRVPRRSAE